MIRREGVRSVNKELVKKGFIVGLIGFPVGIVVGVVFLFIGSGEAGSEWGAAMIALHILLSGILGGVSMGSSVVYEAESWSVTRCTLTHFVVTFTTMLTIGFSLGWFHLGDISSYIFIGCMLVGYFMIWIIMYAISKKQAKELDEDLKRWKVSHNATTNGEKDIEIH